MSEPRKIPPMFLSFLYRLRKHDVPVGAQEAISLSKALMAGLHDSSLDGFYYVARALCVHREGHLDAFDQAFLAEFKGVEGEHAADPFHFSTRRALATEDARQWHPASTKTRR